MYNIQKSMLNYNLKDKPLILDILLRFYNFFIDIFYMQNLPCIENNAKSKVWGLNTLWLLSLLFSYLFIFPLFFYIEDNVKFKI